MSYDLTAPKKYPLIFAMHYLRDYPDATPLDAYDHAIECMLCDGYENVEFLGDIFSIPYFRLHIERLHANTPPASFQDVKYTKVLLEELNVVRHEGVPPFTLQELLTVLGYKEVSFLNRLFPVDDLPEYILRAGEEDALRLLRHPTLEQLEKIVRQYKQ